MNRGVKLFRRAIMAPLFLMVASYSFGQKGETGNQPDTILLEGNRVLVLDKDVVVPHGDTTIILPPHTKYHIRKNPYETSEAFYKSLETKTGKKKLTREMYDFLIVRSDKNITDSVQMYQKKQLYEPFRGKRIVRILYTDVDVYEGNVDDTLKNAVSNVGKLMNKMHVSTRHLVIRNNLFFKRGDLLDPDQMADNERVLRRLPYIQDARIQVVQDPNDPEAVVVIVITQDQFPWGITPDMQDIDRFGLSLSNSNVAGLGHQVYGGILVNLKDTISHYGYKIGYRFDNIGGSFISGKVDFLNAQGRRWLGLKAKRDFLTPQTKWGGGISYNIHRNDSIWVEYKDTVVYYNYSANIQDYWLGRSFLINKQKRRRIVFSARFKNDKFQNKPYIEPDSNLVFHDKSIIMGSMLLLQKDYYKTSLVYNFGQAEDIPYGYMFRITGGYLKDEFFNRPYIGLLGGWAKFFEGVGYFSFRGNAGGFIYNSGWKDVLVAIKSVYISPISGFGRYKIRQIGSLFYIVNASDSSSQFVKYYGSIIGLQESDIWGKSALSVSLESILFTPWYFYGFRFAPFGVVSMGLISKNKNVFVKPGWNGAIKLGLRIYNASLVFNRIDLSISYLINNGGTTSPIRFDFSTNKDYIRLQEGVERPTMVYELYQ